MHLRAPSGYAEHGYRLTICDQSVPAVQTTTHRTMVSCNECLNGIGGTDPSPKQIQAEQLNRLFGGEASPTIGEMLTHLLAGGGPHRLINVLRDTDGYICCVDQEAHERDPELWCALAGTIIELAKRS